MNLRLPPSSSAVDAIVRYDPNLSVRYSPQYQKWAICYRPSRPDLIPPPVKVTRTAAGLVEERLPEMSEASISYRTKTMPVGYVSTLSHDVVRQVYETDTQRKGRVSRQLKKMDDARRRDQRRVEQDRRREAYKFMRWHARTHPMSD